MDSTYKFFAFLAFISVIAMGILFVRFYAEIFEWIGKMIRKLKKL